MATETGRLRQGKLAQFSLARVPGTLTTEDFAAGMALAGHASSMNDETLDIAAGLPLSVSVGFTAVVGQDLAGALTFGGSLEVQKFGPAVLSVWSVAAQIIGARTVSRPIVSSYSVAPQILAVRTVTGGN